MVTTKETLSIMSIISDKDGFKDLSFPLHDMLGVPETESLCIEIIPGPTTSITLRVRSDNNPDINAFVKTVKKDSASDAHIRLGIREVRFYQFIERLNPDPYPNIPRCLNSRISPDEKAYFLVLEDLSESHQDYQSLDFSKINNWKYGLRALAKFHRSFTQKLSEEQIQAHADDEQDIEAYIGKLEDAFSKFKCDNRDCVPDTTIELLERCIPLIRAFELEKVYQVRQNQLATILHRDAHLKNFLYPRVGGSETMIVDWQFWGVGIGTFDLRHLLGSALGGDLRGRQQELVRFYYQEYVDGLDYDYSWEDCWSDYRKGIVDNLYMPVWQYTGFGWGVDRWGKTLASAVENFYDLNCDEFLRQK
jgi:hypothetical protein